jgi:hypothetical protein
MGESEIPVVDETVSRSQLRAEIDRLIERLEDRGSQAFDPPPFTLAGLIQLLEQSIRYFAPDARLEMLQRFPAAGWRMARLTWKRCAEPGIWPSIRWKCRRIL